ncbi:hypothetical protein [Thermomonas sp.]|uniref:hypothetical protein n=1 Tax=Thermomonas sp. TaxID=1971895 RepID=UPI002488D413|nr:hypothetical protein [Thermomonas sp.]MDI1253844.1 hypothetical protein [Thermomonas sp.]
MVTLTLAIETDSDSMEDIEAAICSELAGAEFDFDCTEALPDGSDGERTQLEVRIAIAKTKDCRVDAGVSRDYAHPDAAPNKKIHSVGGRQIVCG